MIRGEGRVIACPSMSEDLKFKRPFPCIVSGPSGSAKTSFYVSLLQSIAALCNERQIGGGIV